MNLARLFQAGIANRLVYCAPVDDRTGGGDEGGGSDSGGQSDEGGNGGNDDEGDGKPSEEVVKLLKEVMSKKDKITTLTDSNNKLTEQLSKYEGVDLEEIATLRTELENFKKAERDRTNKQLEDKGDWGTLKQQLVDDHQSALDQVVSENKQKLVDLKSALTQEKQDLQNTVENQQIIIEELTLGNAFASSLYVSENLQPSSSKIRQLYQGHFDVVDGKLHPFDKPRSAEGRRPIIDGDGKPMTFDKALQKIVEADPDKETILKAKQRSGGGSDTNNRKSTTEGKPVRGVSRIKNAL